MTRVGRRIIERSLGSSLSALHAQGTARLRKCTNESRERIMNALSAASMESYTRAYPYLLFLHMLQVS